MRALLPYLVIVSGGIACWNFSQRSQPREAAAPAHSPSLQRDAQLPSPGHKILGGEWRDLLSRCRDAEDPASLRRELAATKNRWLAEDYQVTARTIGQLLRSGADAPTGIPFETGPGGILRGWPTMRVFLLDVLAATDPDLAVDIAREILASTDSADEFAVALKPLMLRGPWKASDEELQAHFSKLLGNEAWQDTAGLAEALDLPRVAGFPAAVETLARWVDTSPPALEVGTMALHETAAQHPDLVVRLITEDGDLLATQPELRAGLMARAAVSDSGQAADVEGYLKDPAVTVAEKQQFLDLFPLRSATTGYRLYGKPPSPFDEAIVQEDDRAALESVTRWRADPVLQELSADLGALETRLQGWVRQAGD